MSDANVYDRAHLLAQAVKGSREYADFRLAMARLSAEKSARNMLRDFRRRQFELQSRAMQGQEISDEDQDRLGKLAELVAGHAVIGQYMQAEYALSQLLADIQKILADAIEVERDDDRDDDDDEDDAADGTGEREDQGV